MDVCGGYTRVQQTVDAAPGDAAGVWRKAEASNGAIGTIEFAGVKELMDPLSRETQGVGYLCQRKETWLCHDDSM